MQIRAVLSAKQRSQSGPESFKACNYRVSRTGCLSHHQRGGPNMAKKVATPATVTLKHLAAALSEDHELSKKAAEAILGDLVDRITKHLKKGERIRIVGLGILQVRKRAARMGRNPATGEAIHIKASKKVAFRAAKELKEAV
ncbi:MAG TPA: HU family DNA-binding protein [Stellaceae bacterium]|nr:HU family DNA-binding protein [Stellaceae bacterium]